MLNTKVGQQAAIRRVRFPRRIGQDGEAQVGATSAMQLQLPRAFDVFGAAPSF